MDIGRAFKMLVFSKVVIILWVAVEVVAAQADTTSDIDLTPLLTDHFGKYVKCTTKHGKEGQCVNERFCNQDHVILPGGDIEDIDLREKHVCVGELDWCCSVELLNTPTQAKTTPNDRCLATNDEESSWTVALYKLQPENPQSSRLFCAGVLISSNVVLTSATCLLAARSHKLYVHAPASTVKKNYTVQYRVAHKDYNSGTHVHDFGILVLEKNVEWGDEKPRSACLDFITKLQGDCLATGFSSDFDVATTLLTVEQKGCRPKQDPGDVCCGTNVSDSDDCIITPGAPVLCLSSDKVLTVVGVSRSVCKDNKRVSIGELSSVKTWLQSELQKINLQQSVYTYKKL
ncbi:uncharacterized protein LOC116775325 [Danaus plexippus]|uniref:Large serine protease n=1 Tax=Danaus plexippus plexippus TaxID=278856 RepID=A0A212FB73_DANPL|nr:uncharacterized protein LOC116775325 [Danaus plexippus]OWR50986.1 large serine protease [Danaus plexippus plexippus]